AESVLWLEQHLKTYPGAVIAITHDRYFLDHVAEWIAEVDRGHLYPYEGNYSTYLEKKRERLQVQGKKDAKLAKRLKDELEWVRSNPRRSRRSRRRVWPATRRWPPRRRRHASSTSKRSRSRPDPVWAMSSSRRTRSRRASTGVSSSKG